MKASLHRQIVNKNPRASSTPPHEPEVPNRVAQNARGVVKGRYCASHKNWIRNIRFSIMNRPLSQ